MVAKITQLPWTKAQIEHVEVVRINGPQRDTCERKKCYTTYGEADRDATELHRKTGGEIFDVYKCRFGNHYHVGHHIAAKKTRS